MSEALPPTMVASLVALGHAMVQIATTERDGSLAVLEEAVLTAVRTALPELLVEVVQQGTSCLQSPARRPPCPACGQWGRVQSWRERTVTTICGPITLERPWYVCRGCGHGFSPADATWQLEPRARVSAGLADWLVEQGATTSFAEAARHLGRLTGLVVSPETIRQYTERRGTALEAAAQAASATVAATREAAGPVDPAPGTLVVETDGVMVRYRDGFHEVKLGVVAGRQDGRTLAPSYLAVRTSAEQFGPRLLAEAARRGALEIVAWRGPVLGRGLAELRPVAVLGDGAPWIWHLAAAHFGKRTEIVDFYHASAHVWTAATALHGEGTALSKAWAAERITELLETGAAPVLRALTAATAPTPAAAEVLRLERGYFRTNEARMAYPVFRAQGLPIGSGAVEGSGKHLVQARMKRPGARWSEAGAQAVLNVRSRMLSDLPLAC